MKKKYDLPGYIEPEKIARIKKQYHPPKCVTLEDVYLDRGFIYIDDIKLGKYIVREGKAYLQLKDPSAHRATVRGTILVEILIDDLGRIKFNSG